MKYIRPSVLAVLVLIWMTIIFSFSSQPAVESASVSSPLAQTVADLFCPSFEHLNQAEQQRVLDTCSFIVRKIAHFTEYALLGFLTTLTLTSFRSARRNEKWGISVLKCKLPLIAFLIGTLYAASDEIHQCFVPGRSGQITDLLLDSVGVAAGVLFVCLIAKIIMRPSKTDRRRS